MKEYEWTAKACDIGKDGKFVDNAPEGILNPKGIKGVSKEMKEALEAVGFHETESPGFFTHEFINGEIFDFTPAANVYDAILRVFRREFQLGKESAQETIRTAIGIKEE